MWQVTNIWELVTRPPDFESDCTFELANLALTICYVCMVGFFLPACRPTSPLPTVVVLLNYQILSRHEA